MGGSNQVKVRPYFENVSVKSSLPPCSDENAQKGKCTQEKPYTDFPMGDPVDDLNIVGAQRIWFGTNQAGEQVIGFQPDLSDADGGKSGLTDVRNPNAAELSQLDRFYTQPIPPEEMAKRLISNWDEIAKEKRAELEEMEIPISKEAAAKGVTKEKKREELITLFTCAKLWPILQRGEQVPLDPEKLISGVLEAYQIHQKQKLGIILGAPETPGDPSSRPAYMYLFDKRLNNTCPAKPVISKFTLGAKIKPHEALSLIEFLDLSSSDYCFPTDQLNGLKISKDLAQSPGADIILKKIEELTGIPVNEIPSRGELKLRKAHPVFDAENAKAFAEALRDFAVSRVRQLEEIKKQDDTRAQQLGMQREGLDAQKDAASLAKFSLYFMGGLSVTMLLQSYFLARQQGWTKPVDPYIDRMPRWVFQKIFRIKEKVDFVTDLRKISKTLKPATGREQFMRDFRVNFRTVEGEIRTLVAAAGTGKSYVLNGFAYEIYHDLNGKHYTEPGYDANNRMFPEFDPKNTEVLRLELGQLSGHEDSKYVGQIERRFNDFKRQVKEAVMSGKRVLVQIDEIHRIEDVGKTGEGTTNLANTIKTWVSQELPELIEQARAKHPNSRVDVIGATTTDEYRRHIYDFVDFEQTGWGDKAVGRRLPHVILPELEGEVLIRARDAIADRYEKQFDLVIPKEVRERALELSYHPKVLASVHNPAGVRDILQEAAAQAQIDKEDGKGDGTVTLENLHKTFVSRRGMDVEDAQNWKGTGWNRRGYEGDPAKRDNYPGGPYRKPAAQGNGNGADKAAESGKASPNAPQIRWIRELAGRELMERKMGIDLNAEILLNQHYDGENSGDAKTNLGDAKEVVRKAAELARRRMDRDPTAPAMVMENDVRRVQNGWDQADKVLRELYQEQGKNWRALESSTKARIIWRLQGRYHQEKKASDGSEIDMKASFRRSLPKILESATAVVAPASQGVNGRETLSRGGSGSGEGAREAADRADALPLELRVVRHLEAVDPDYSGYTDAEKANRIAFVIDYYDQYSEIHGGQFDDIPRETVREAFERYEREPAMRRAEIKARYESRRDSLIRRARVR